MEESMHSKKRALALCPLPSDGQRQESQVAREQDARAYWERLSPAQEGWVLKKMRFAEMGKL